MLRGLKKGRYCSCLQKGGEEDPVHLYIDLMSNISLQQKIKQQVCEHLEKNALLAGASRSLSRTNCAKLT